MTYHPTADPRVTAAVDLLTDAVMAANNAGRTTVRYTHRHDVTPRDVERASHAASLAQTAAANAIYDLAAALAADGAGVAS